MLFKRIELIRSALKAGHLESQKFSQWFLIWHLKELMSKGADSSGRVYTWFFYCSALIDS